MLPRHYRSIVTLCALVGFVSVRTPAQSKPYLVYQLKTLNGSNARLQDFTQKGYAYVTFWALWCGPCRAEFDALGKLTEEGKIPPYVTLVAVNIDNTKSSAKVQAFVKARKGGIPVLLDPTSQLMDLLGGKEIPFSIIVDSKGTIIEKRTGFLPGDEKKIAAVLSNLQPPQ